MTILLHLPCFDTVVFCRPLQSKGIMAGEMKAKTGGHDVSVGEDDVADYFHASHLGNNVPRLSAMKTTSPVYPGNDRDASLLFEI